MRVLRFAVPVVLAAALAACGNSPTRIDSGSSPAASLTPEVSAPAEASSPDPATAAGSGADAPPASGTMDGAALASKVADAAFAKQTVTMDMTGDGGTTISGVVRYGKVVEEALTIGSSGRELRAVLVGGVMYLDLGQKINGKSWLKIDPKSKNPMIAAMAPLLGTLQQQSNLRSLAAGLKGVKAVAGPGETVDGAQTTAYRVVMNSKQLVAALPAAQRKLLGPAMAGTSATTTYYVDGEWLPRKVVIVTRSKGKTSTQTVTYSKWGEPVTIAAPAPSDVTTSFG